MDPIIYPIGVTVAALVVAIAFGRGSDDDTAQRYDEVMARSRDPQIFTDAVYRAWVLEDLELTAQEMERRGELDRAEQLRGRAVEILQSAPPPAPPNPNPLPNPNPRPPGPNPIPQPPDPFPQPLPPEPPPPEPGCRASFSLLDKATHYIVYAAVPATAVLLNPNDMRATADELDAAGCPNQATALRVAAVNVENGLGGNFLRAQQPAAAGYARMGQSTMTPLPYLPGFEPGSPLLRAATALQDAVRFNMDQRFVDRLRQAYDRLPATFAAPSSAYLIATARGAPAPRPGTGASPDPIPAPYFGGGNVEHPFGPRWRRFSPPIHPTHR